MDPWVNITTPGRQKILIPWAEDDPGLAGPELWVERVLHHARLAQLMVVTDFWLYTGGLLRWYPNLRHCMPQRKDDAASVESVYTDWATANFGPEVAAQIAHLFVS